MYHTHRIKKLPTYWEKAGCKQSEQKMHENNLGALTINAENYTESRKRHIWNENPEWSGVPWVDDKNENVSSQ